MNETNGKALFGAMVERVKPVTGRGLLAGAVRKLAKRISVDEVDVLALDHAAELLRVLARVVEGKDALEAMGAPGDWGYGTPLGEGLLAALNECRDEDRPTPEESEAAQAAAAIGRGM